MDIQLLEHYRAYKEGDQIAGEFIASQFYRHLSYWIEYGKPEESFLSGFWELFTDIQETHISGRDLIDLGLLQTAEAITSYREEKEDRSTLEYYLFEARLPFFAFMDENAYRIMKNIDFAEIDFQIFDIIQGIFPHDTAQNFLMDNEWVDIWTTLRYLDSLEDPDFRIEMIEKLISRRRTIHEKLIFLAYLIVTEPEAVEPGLPRKLELPSELTDNLVNGLFAILDAYLNTGVMDVNWEHRIPTGYLREVLFTLLAIFEITQSEFSAGWIRLMELCFSTIWVSPVEDPKGQVRNHQPLQEFAASILSLLPEAELNYILEVSLILPLFMENLDAYSDFVLEDILNILGRHSGLLLKELEVAIPESIDRRHTERFRRGHISRVARFLGYEISIQDEGYTHLTPIGESHN